MKRYLVPLTFSISPYYLYNINSIFAPDVLHVTLELSVLFHYHVSPMNKESLYSLI